MNTWEVVITDGRIFVNGSPPMLNAYEKGTFDRDVWRWFDLADEYSKAAGIPTHWTLGIIYSESLGRPNVRSSVGAVGLMQLYSAAARQGHSLDECLDPALNIRLGTEYLRALVSPKSPDLPPIASRYNAGQQADGSPHPANNEWGMRENHGYISRVVAASNTALERMRLEHAGAEVPVLPFLLGIRLLGAILK